MIASGRVPKMRRMLFMVQLLLWLLLHVFCVLSSDEETASAIYGKAYVGADSFVNPKIATVLLALDDLARFVSNVKRSRARKGATVNAVEVRGFRKMSERERTIGAKPEIVILHKEKVFIVSPQCFLHFAAVKEARQYYVEAIDKRAVLGESERAYEIARLVDALHAAINKIDFRIVVEGAGHQLQGVLTKTIVIRYPSEVFALGVGEADIKRGRKLFIDFVADIAYSAVLGCIGVRDDWCVVGRAVVYDYEFPRRKRLAQHAI